MDRLTSLLPAAFQWTRLASLAMLSAVVGVFDVVGCDPARDHSSSLGRSERGAFDGAGVGGEGGKPFSDAEFAVVRGQMVDDLATSIRDERVLDALRKVPRHEFVPVAQRSRSYHDVPLPVSEGQTITRPLIVALMTELLELDGSERVLEVGTGSGYQASVLAELAAEVFTVEIKADSSAAAKDKVSGLQGRGLVRDARVTFVVGDGNKGHPPGAPYDAILVTAAASRVPEALQSQLKPNGRLVIPVGDNYFQELLLVTKDDKGEVSERSMKLVRLIKLQEKESGREE